ncbi:MAG: RagB/SusD family nutrient uptake outer membrane protein [Chitinophagaceae bacterium]|nr:RagB/SusD family nutrient uptake outer membrane protein [Chitinophagaceae bacterium]
MKNVRKYIGGLFAAAILFSVGCSKKLDVPPPNNLQDQQIRDLLANGTPEQIKLIMGSMANNMPLTFNTAGIFGMGVADISYYTNQGLGVMRNLEANDIVLGDQAISDVLAGSIEYNLGNFQGSSGGANNVAFWYYAWGNITKANQMLGFLPDDVVANNSFLQDAKARALVVRAYSYNFLMENYQDAYTQGGKTKLGMPLYTEFNPNQQFQARASAEDTYRFIKTDLTNAISLLQAAGTGYTANPSDIDLGVANFVLARVSLVTGDWPAAVTACNSILSGYSGLSLMTEAAYGGKNTGTPANPVFDPVDNGFLNNDKNPEVILGFPTGIANNYFNSLMNPFGPSYGGLNRAYKRIDERLYNLIADDDYRKDCFQDNTDFGNFTYQPSGTVNTLPSYINFKFAATQSLDGNKDLANSSTCYYMRSSEVLLMKAEALAQQSGQESEAKNTLNQLLAARTRGGSPVLTVDNYPAMAGMTALQMVQLQTRIEMWGEGGLEYYNNRRWNIPVDRSSSNNHINKGQLPVSKMTAEIPFDEMNNNPLMVQN